MFLRTRLRTGLGTVDSNRHLNERMSALLLRNMHVGAAINKTRLLFHGAGGAMGGAATSSFVTRGRTRGRLFTYQQRIAGRDLP